MSSIFGGSKSKQQSTNTSKSESVSENGSWNQAYPSLMEKYGGQMDQGIGANKFLGSLLGLDGGSAGRDALDQYKNSAGYDFIMKSGIDGIENSAAGKGLLKSGATLKGLENHRQNVGTQFYNNFLDRLLGLSNQGIQAGGLVAGAGQQSYGKSNSTASSYGQSTGTSSSNPGISGFLGSLSSAIAASDPRLKYDVVRLGELPNGLGLYSFKHIGDDDRVVGVMADEVAEKQPDALGPEIDGFMTVDYDKIWEALDGPVS